MKIAVVGAGGVGGYYGGLLSRAGHEVAFLARGEHLRALRERGLKVDSPHGGFHVSPVSASDSPAEIGPVALTIFSVKTYDTDAAAALMAPLVGPDTTILPLQNGVESAGRLAERYGAGRVLGGATWIASSIAEPGVVRQESAFRRIVLGELDGRMSKRAQVIRDALAETGADVELSGDIDRVLWTKLVFIASFGGLASVTRAPAGPIRQDAEARSLLIRAMHEVQAAAGAKGVTLEEDVVDKTTSFFDGLDPTTTPSMLRDVQAGRRLEHDALNGAIVRAGRAGGVPTPVHEFLWSCLRVVDAMAAGGIP